MKQTRFLASVEADLVAILRRITRETGSLATGQRFVGELREKCHHLASLPGTLGRARPELRPDIRSFPFKGYVIFFRYTQDAFEIVDILEGHRDLGAFFTEDQSG